MSSTAPAAQVRSASQVVPTPRVLLVIPCFNEAGSIRSVLKEISSAGDYGTIVIDDGSSDRTFEIASKHSAAVRLICNLGIGGAVQTGIKYAYRRGYDFCVQIDGDGQHPASQIDVLVKAAVASGASIVIGSRYLKNDTFRSTWSRRLGSGLIAWALKVCFRGVRVTDPTSGMRLLDRKAMALFADHYPADFPEPVSLAWALQAGLSLGEVPVQMRSREHGQSSITGLKTLSYMVRVLVRVGLARLRTLRQP